MTDASPNPLQTPVDAASNDARKPSIDFHGVRIFAARDGDAVTGWVEFPYQTYGCKGVRINYRSRRPDPDAPAQEGGLNTRERFRLDLTERYLTLRRGNRLLTAKAAAKRLTCPGASVRAIQGWARKLEMAGPDGLRDKYVPAPKAVPIFDPDHARGAMLVCAWWSFRIGNVDSIDPGIVSAAVALLSAGHTVADLLATIDCYYSWPCNRERFAFKPFHRWSRYDLDKWIMRAADVNDYRRALNVAQQERTPLLPPAEPRASKVPDARTRSRDANNRKTRSAIRYLDNNTDPSPKRQRGVSADAHPKRGVLADADAKRLSATDTMRVSKLAGVVAGPAAARRAAAAIPVDPPALAANTNPQSVAEAMAALDDGYRIMLLNAAQGDRESRKQAVATMPLWWPSMPTRDRHNIDFKVDSWRSDHPRVGPYQVAARKVDMLLPLIRSRRCGTHRLGVAARLPT